MYLSLFVKHNDSMYRVVYGILNMFMVLDFPFLIKNKHVKIICISGAPIIDYNPKSDDYWCHPSARVQIGLSVFW